MSVNSTLIDHLDNIHVQSQAAADSRTSLITDWLASIDSRTSLTVYWLASLDSGASLTNKWLASIDSRVSLVTSWLSSIDSRVSLLARDIAGIASGMSVANSTLVGILNSQTTVNTYTGNLVRWSRPVWMTQKILTGIPTPVLADNSTATEASSVRHFGLYISTASAGLAGGSLLGIGIGLRGPYGSNATLTMFNAPMLVSFSLPSTTWALPQFRNDIDAGIGGGGQSSNVSFAALYALTNSASSGLRVTFSWNQIPPVVVATA